MKSNSHILLAPSSHLLCAYHSPPAPQIAPGAYGAPSEGEGDAAVAYPTGSDVVVAAAAACLGQVLTVVAAPVSYLFGTLGGVPGWFSDVVFEVRRGAA